MQCNCLCHRPGMPPFDILTYPPKKCCECSESSGVQMINISSCNCQDEIAELKQGNVALLNQCADLRQRIEKLEQNKKLFNTDIALIDVFMRIKRLEDKELHQRCNTEKEGAIEEIQKMKYTCKHSGIQFETRQAQDDSERAYAIGYRKGFDDGYLEALEKTQNYLTNTMRLIELELEAFRNKVRNK